MTGKPTISARDTYVLDPDEISQLDELSLTSVMRQVPDPLESDRGRTEPTMAPTVSGVSTINELLKEAPDRAAGSLEAEDDLIAPEILFPEGADDDL